MPERTETSILFKTIKILTDDYQFCESWQHFCRSLEFDTPMMYDLERMARYRPIIEVIMKVMTYWKTICSSKTNLKTLCEQLREIECIRCAENIEELSKDVNSEIWVDSASLPDRFTNLDILLLLVKEKIITDEEMEEIKNFNVPGQYLNAKAMRDIINSEIPIFFKIVKILSDDPVFCKEWKSFCVQLQFKTQVNDLEKMDKFFRPITEIIIKILLDWKMLRSTDANLIILYENLKDFGCIRSAETIEDLISHFNSDMWNDDTSLPKSTTYKDLLRLVEKKIITVDELQIIKLGTGIGVPAEHLPEMWGVPHQNSQFVGRVDLIENVKECFNQGNTMAAYNGLGGVGKTQIALEFVWQHYKEYNGVIWFNAKDKTCLLEDYIQFGNTHYLLCDNEGQPIEDQARYIKHWFEKPTRAGWLIIYDNAPRYGGVNGISEYLPVSGGKILITSRYSQGWSQSFSVEVFTREVSTMFVENILPGKSSEEERITLAETLGDLPLALAQACAYINKNNVTVSRYLEIYEEKQSHLLQDKTLSKSKGTIPADSSTADVYSTWDSTMNIIREESLLAANFLTICAYLPSNDIPDCLIEILMQNPDVNPNSEECEVAMEILRNYSMITTDVENKIVSIHPLLQEVIKLKEKQRKLMEAQDTHKTSRELKSEALWKYYTLQIIQDITIHFSIALFCQLFY